MPSYVFNTSMFVSAPDHAEIASAVARLCEDKIGIEGLSNVHIPWAQAKGLAAMDPSYTGSQMMKGKPLRMFSGHSKLYDDMIDLIDRVQNAKRKDSQRGKHVKVIFRYITATTSFNVFYSRLKWILKRLNETSGRVNVIYYTNLKDD